MASAAARLLFLSGFPVVVLERAEPLAVRRLVSFAEAIRTGQAVVDGVTARRVAEDQLGAERGFVAVAVDEDGASIARLQPEVLVDARMLKSAAGASRGQARLVIGVGPGFFAGKDVHAVVETQRGPDLGRVLWSGSAAPDTAKPAAVLGYTEKRVVRAPRAGVFTGGAQIGDIVVPGQVVGHVDGAPVTGAIPGMLRGLLADGVHVGEGVKVGDIDPRGPTVSPARISDKARAVAAGVLEAVLIGQPARTPGLAPHAMLT
jgi:xanthine dehydrogenase accessory factor